MFFIRWLNGAKAIVVRDPDTGTEKELYRAYSPESVSHLAVSPDGQHLAFFWRDSKNGTAALKVILSQDGEMHELSKLPSPELSNYGQSVFEMAWTPDSRHLIYTSTIAGQNRFEFWRISAEGGEPEILGLSMEGLLPYGLSVHPDGRGIAFTAGTPPREEVWVIENFLPALNNGD